MKNLTPLTAKAGGPRPRGRNLHRLATDDHGCTRCAPPRRATPALRPHCVRPGTAWRTMAAYKKRHTAHESFVVRYRYSRKRLRLVPSQLRHSARGKDAISISASTNDRHNQTHDEGLTGPSCGASCRMDAKRKQAGREGGEVNRRGRTK